LIPSSPSACRAPHTGPTTCIRRMTGGRLGRGRGRRLPGLLPRGAPGEAGPLVVELGDRQPAELLPVVPVLAAVLQAEDGLDQLLLAAPLLLDELPQPVQPEELGVGRR